MKKLLAILLSLIFVFCLAACGNNMDEEATQEVIAKVYEANKNINLLQNHSSVAFTVENPFIEEKTANLEAGETLAVTSKNATNYISYSYETPDYAYIKTESTIWYRMPARLSYQYNYKDGELSKKVYHASFENNYTPYMLSIVPELEMDWYDKYHETIKKCYEEDGEIHIISDRDETGSKYFLEDIICYEYGGEIISTELICDAKTYEIKSITYSDISEKEAKTVYKITVEYDKPGISEIDEMRADFENPDVKKNNVLFVQNPRTSTTTGSTNEMTVTFKANAGYSIKYQPDSSVTYSAYTDPACTKPVIGTWDKQSDIERYIVTKAK